MERKRNFIKKFFDRLSQDSPANAIFRNMAKLASGDGLARIIGLLTTPIITRIYLPEHMGVLAVFVALVSMMGPLGTFRYSLAIPLPKTDGMALNIGVLAALILAVNSGILLLVFLFFGPFILAAFSMEQLIEYRWLIIIAFTGTGIYELLTNWAVRIRAFYALAKTKVWQKTLGASFKIALGLLGMKPLGLLIGQIFTQAGGIISLFRTFSLAIYKDLRFVTLKRIIFASKRFSDFPKYRAPSHFLLILTGKIPLLYFARYFGIDVTGQLGLALLMLSMPITIIGYSTGKAFYSEIARIGKKNPQVILNITKNIAKKLLLTSIVPFLILVLFGPWLFSLVFGEVWETAGRFASTMAIYLLAQFVYSPIGDGIFNVFEKQSTLLLVEAARLFLTVGAFLISHFLVQNANEALFIYSMALTLHYIFATFIAFRIIKHASLMKINH